VATWTICPVEPALKFDTIPLPQVFPDGGGTVVGAAQQLANGPATGFKRKFHPAELYQRRDYAGLVVWV
jgi:hypothetical protein